MATPNLLTMLKTDLGITSSTTVYDDRLAQYIKTTQREIGREGIDLDLSDIDDCSLVVMYASWLWRQRDTMSGMPRMIRYALNNRLFSQKMKRREDADD